MNCLAENMPDAKAKIKASKLEVIDEAENEAKYEFLTQMSVIFTCLQK